MCGFIHCSMENFPVFIPLKKYYPSSCQKSPTEIIAFLIIDGDLGVPCIFHTGIFLLVWFWFYYKQMYSEFRHSIAMPCPADNTSQQSSPTFEFSKSLLCRLLLKTESFFIQYIFIKVSPLSIFIHSFHLPSHLDSLFFFLLLKWTGF